MRLWNLGACVLALVLASCGGESTTVEQQEMGTLRLQLLSSSSGGRVYGLKGATFTITGPQTVTLSGETPDASLQTTLQAGAYTIQLGDGWHLEDLAAPGTAVSAQLLSPNPLPFFVTKGELTEVRFQFKLPGEGSADVGIVVDNGGWLAGTIQFTEREPYGAPPGTFDELVGKSVPFLITYNTATYTKDSYYGKALRVESGPVTVQFGGAPSELLDRAASSLKGARIMYELRTAGPAGVLYFAGLMWTTPTPEAFRIEFGPMDSFQGAVDGEGFPAKRPFETNIHDFVLRDGMSSDGARGPSTLSGQP
jgi:hypothetical protein